MGKYSDDTTWDDIVPLPQDDGGPNPLAAIAYTDDYSEAMSYLRATMAKNEMSERALALTEDIIDMNAAHYTVWFAYPLPPTNLTVKANPFPSSQALPLRNPQSPKRRPLQRTRLAQRNRTRTPKKLSNLASSPIGRRSLGFMQRRSRVYISNV
jgi:hypothetical protein